MTNNVIESSGLVRNRQSIDMRSVESIGDAKVRIVIHLDTSYPRLQSTARAEVWSPQLMQWSRAAFMTSGEWTDATYACPGGGNAAEQAVLDAADHLRGQLLAILA